MHVDADVVGEYGVHSDVSRQFAQLFDKSSTITPALATAPSSVGAGHGNTVGGAKDDGHDDNGVFYVCISTP